ncbi:MAG: alanine--tRNA ligase [Phycisphaera sp.]|nr:alanine--tRNA ligase [Phycisphaera sp.]
MPTSREIRQQFIDFFTQKHAHTFVPSSPVVPHSDPTLLFTNAGMNQFKPYFLGTEKPPYPRAANTQKCIRAGGKHNDLEDVGKDTYHHTFFEMLGNWSFGDYFKKEAIAWAWELLVDVWKLDPNRLHATYFQGDPSEGLEPDNEARDLWMKYLPGERIHPGNKKDNFWEMGDTGPCGPCSEIHIDQTPDMTGGHLVNAGDARVMEIWNLVFIQFNRSATGLSPLPAKHVDTGMGFERICSVIQNTGSNYDTDVFTPIFKAIQRVTGARPYGKKLDDPIDTAYRVIADHIRTLTFALTDGAVPGNDGRNYVLRRILRRAFRYGRQTLGVHKPFLCELVPGVVDAMGEAFPELTKNPQHVIDLIKDEEESFGKTIDRGIALFEEAASKAKTISGGDAFKLHDTFGFPLDLTQLMAQERGMTVDVEGFEKLMEQARETSRAGTSGGVDVHAQLVDIVQKNTLPATEFVGYTHTQWAGQTTAQLFSLEGLSALVTGKTPFYAESGGQVGDTGSITSEGFEFTVTDTQKIGEVYFHIGSPKGTLPPGMGTSVPMISMKVDPMRRARIMSNHTTTHVMNHKLRAVLGEHVQQKGSLVDPDKLRFDFSHNAALDDEQVRTIEQLTNDDIAKDLSVYASMSPIDDAKKIHSLRAVFGEKYPPVVRVVSIGVPPEDLLKDPDNRKWHDYSIEFCGGTHLPRTGDAEGFVIVSEEAVGKGVRRITALTGEAANEADANGTMLLGRLEAHKGNSADDLPDAVAELTKKISEQALPLTTRTLLRTGIAELQQRIKEHEKEKVKEAAGNVVEVARKIADEHTGPVIVAALEGYDGDALRTAMDVVRKKHPESALLLGSVAGDKIAFIAAVPKGLIDKGLKAGDWVREVAKVAGGGGGGRPDMAQAGGKDPTKLPDALKRAAEYAAQAL